MAKEKKKEFNLQKLRTKSQAHQVLKELEGVTAEEVISYTYRLTHDPFDIWLMREIEKMLLKAILDPEYFKANLYSYLKRTAKDIKDNKQIKKYYSFCFESYQILPREYDERNNSTRISVAYYDMLVELSQFLVGLGRFVHGITTSGELMTVPELYPNIDVYVHDCFEHFKNKAVDLATVQAYTTDYFKKKGFKVEKFEDIDHLFGHERIYTNSGFIMASLIDEHYTEFLKLPFIQPFIRLVKFYPTKRVGALYGNLKERKRLLPSKGVTIERFGNSNIQELYLREKFTHGRLFLLYRVKVDNSYFAGFYDVSKEFFHSIYEDSREPIARAMHTLLEAFVLEIYATLTSNAKTEHDLRFTIEDDPEGGSYSLSEYQRVITHIEPYVRKLPMGATASEEAVKMAEKYGIRLGINETFVREFNKKVRIRKDGNNG